MTEPYDQELQKRMKGRGPRKYVYVTGQQFVFERISGTMTSAEFLKRIGREHPTGAGQSQPDQFLEALQTVQNENLPEAELGARLVGLFQGFGILQNDVEIDHFSKDIFGGWFPGQPVATLFVEALTTAARQAAEVGGTAVEMYWTLSSDAKVRFSVARSPAQVTITFFTPDSNYDVDARPLDATDPILLFEPIRDGIAVAAPIRFSLR